MLIGFLGPKNSGKSSAGSYLQRNFNFHKSSFADPIKDICCLMFGWNRTMMEGDTVESRKWREKIDEKWATLLGIPDFSPRFAMANIGTDMFRDLMHQDIWVH